jgi:hypothetical protein
MNLTLLNSKFLDKLKSKGFYNPTSCDYTHIKYEKYNKKVLIIDKKYNSHHLITPEKLLSGVKCSIQNCIEPEKLLIHKFRNTHKDRYIYNFKYINSKSSIPIECKIHGIFHQNIYSHIKGHGCDICGGSKLITQDELIKTFNDIHNHKYGYQFVNYINMKTDIDIWCYEHGLFSQNPYNHSNGTNCPDCKGNKKLDSESVINQFNKIHNNLYTYPKLQYINAHTDIIATCKDHGDFNISPHNHKQGKGCHKCIMSKGEYKILSWLTDNNIKFIYGYRFDDCRNKYPLPFDFYLPDLNQCIEFDGRQHFESVDHFGGDEGLIYRKNNDNVKDIFCESNNIPLLRIHYLDFDRIDDILSKVFCL